MELQTHSPSIELLCYFILLFMVFSVAGWIMEVTLKYIQFHRFINRGFLIGPYCPIYGAGAVLVTAAVHLTAAAIAVTLKRSSSASFSAAHWNIS